MIRSRICFPQIRRGGMVVPRSTGSGGARAARFWPALAGLVDLQYRHPDADLRPRVVRRTTGNPRRQPQPGSGLSRADRCCTNASGPGSRSGSRDRLRRMDRRRLLIITQGLPGLVAAVLALVTQNDHGDVATARRADRRFVRRRPHSNRRRAARWCPDSCRAQPGERAFAWCGRSRQRQPHSSVHSWAASSVTFIGVSGLFTANALSYLAIIARSSR